MGTLDILASMCGRFAINTSKSALLELYRLMGMDRFEDFAPRFNIAPTQELFAVRQGAAGRELVKLRWGLIPAWAKDASMAAKLINARSETVAVKPTFRDAFKKRRCLVPATGFYEWERSGRKKIPYLFGMRDGRLLSFAGLWERWQSPEGKDVETCSLLTTGTNELMAPIHDRTPVIIPPEHFDRWLDVDANAPETLAALLHPFPADAMVCCRVSERVNNARNEGPDLIRSVQPVIDPQLF